MTTGVAEAHKKAMLKVMNYCVSTPKRGMVLKPNVRLTGDPEFKLVILGRSDFAKHPSTRKIVSGSSTFLCGTPIMQRSTMQKIIALSVTGRTDCHNKQCPRYDVCEKVTRVNGFDSRTSNDFGDRQQRRNGSGEQL